MTWLQFATWLILAYGLYYTSVISWDLLRSRQTPQSSEAPVLTFAEEVAVIRPGTISPEEVQAPPVSGSGGVDLKRLFALCRDEAVDYRKAVSY